MSNLAPVHLHPPTWFSRCLLFPLLVCAYPHLCPTLSLWRLHFFCTLGGVGRGMEGYYSSVFMPYRSTSRRSHLRPDHKVTMALFPWHYFSENTFCFPLLYLFLGSPGPPLLGAPDPGWVGVSRIPPPRDLKRSPGMVVG